MAALPHLGQNLSLPDIVSYDLLAQGPRAKTSYGSPGLDRSLVKRFSKLAFAGLLLHTSTVRDLRRSVGISGCDIGSAEACSWIEACMLLVRCSKRQQSSPSAFDAASRLERAFALVRGRRSSPLIYILCLTDWFSPTTFTTHLLSTIYTNSLIIVLCLLSSTALTQTTTSITMCYQIVERYSVCRCLYYRHSVDPCQRYGQRGHSTTEKTVLVGYACPDHSSRSKKSREDDSKSSGGSRHWRGDSGYSSGHPSR
jgi:hypothetical protein